MDLATEAFAMQSDGPSLTGIGAELGELAAGLDALFVNAGTALASTYDIVERLVGSLEGVTNAMNRQAATAAIETMRLTADRLTQLPMEQGRRQRSLEVICGSSDELLQHLHQIRRTLSFLQICGMNIKVTAAGADGFASFADHMFAKLEQAEGQVDEFESEITQLGQNIRQMVAADRLLVNECASVIPRVPQKLAADATALQQLQDNSAALAEQIAGLARDIRNKVAVALGALQIGDITRQRLEHVSESITLLGAHVDACGGDAILTQQARDHVTALVSAQAVDTVENFLRETSTLSDSLRGIAPDAARLAEMQQGGGNGDTQQVLRQLEQNIGEVTSVTRQLCAAEADSAKLGHATSQTADSLSDRLKAVNRIQKDVEQMAWNTALQCRDLGADGRGIAVISEEIQSFSGRLADIWHLVSQSFAKVEIAARTIGEGQADDADLDITGMLLQSLDTIKGGSVRMTESLSGVDQEALQIGAMLRGITDDLSCDAKIAPALVHAVEGLNGLTAAAHRQSSPEEMSEHVRQSITALLEKIHARYTMAREREVHRAFLLTGAETEAVLVEVVAGDDDGLFDDDDDGLF